MGSHFRPPRLRASHSSGRGSTSARHRRLSWYLGLIRRNAADVLVVVRQRFVKACHSANSARASPKTAKHAPPVATARSARQWRAITSLWRVRTSTNPGSGYLIPAAGRGFTQDHPARSHWRVSTNFWREFTIGPGAQAAFSRMTSCAPCGTHAMSFRRLAPAGNDCRLRHGDRTGARRSGVRYRSAAGGPPDQARPERGEGCRRREDHGRVAARSACRSFSRHARSAVT